MQGAGFEGEYNVKNRRETAHSHALGLRWAAGLVAVTVLSAGSMLVAGGPPAAMNTPRLDLPRTSAPKPGAGGHASDVTPDLLLDVDQAGEVRVDAAAVRSLKPGDLVGIAPWRGVEPEVFRVEKFWDDRIDGRSLILRSGEFDESVAVLVERKGWVCMWMQSPAFAGEFEWQFRPIGPGRLVPTPRARDLPACGGAAAPPMGPSEPTGGLARQGVGEDGVTDCLGCSELDVDIAFFYSSALKQRIEDELIAAGEDANGAHDLIVAVCVEDAAITSTAMSNSGLPFGVRAVLVESVAFNESGVDFLDRFAGQGDGEMDVVHDRRDDVFADACTLYTLTNGGREQCGGAYLGDGTDDSKAFSYVLWDCAMSLEFAHQLGHNLGCGHAAGDGGFGEDPSDCTLWVPEEAGCCMPDATVFPPGEGSSTFNHGWRWIDTGLVPACRHTIMALGKTEGDQESKRIGQYSNPDVEVHGYPTGSPGNDPDGRWADNCSVIRANMPGTTRFRCPAIEASGDNDRLVASGLRDADFFGVSLASNGFDLAVGASRHDVAGPNSGAVFMFDDPIDDPDRGWIQKGKLTPVDLEEGARFGESVAMYDDLLVVGAPYSPRKILDDKGEVIEELALAGMVTVWQNDGTGDYCRIATIQPEELRENDEFGFSVAVAGDLLIVGAPLRDTADQTLQNAGAVWVYRRVADVFELVEVIEGELGDGPNGQSGGRFGAAVAAGVQPNGNIMVLVGAPYEQFDYGRVHPYRYVEVDNGWLAIAGDDRIGNWPGGAFGSSIAMDGEDAIVGAPLADDARGGALVFRIDAEDLIQVDQIRLSNFPNGNPRPGDRLGASVAISSTHLGVGVPGRDFFVVSGSTEIELEDKGYVIAYKRDVGTSSWVVHRAYLPLDLRPGDGLGASLGIVGYYLLAGAPEADDSGPISGVVYGLSLNGPGDPGDPGDPGGDIVDCNENGIDDSVDILITGESDDHNGNNIPDECEIGTCLADLNADGIVDGEDLGLFFVAWGDCPKNPDPDAWCIGDFDGNGSVGGVDLGIFCTSWGRECPPDEPGL